MAWYCIRLQLNDKDISERKTPEQNLRGIYWKFESCAKCNFLPEMNIEAPVSDEDGEGDEEHAEQEVLAEEGHS